MRGETARVAHLSYRPSEVALFNRRTIRKKSSSVVYNLGSMREFSSFYLFSRANEMLFNEIDESLVPFRVLFHYRRRIVGWTVDFY